MSIPNSLTVECKSCRISKYCPRCGSSPLRLPSGKMGVCRLVGGYGKKSVDISVLSKESKELFDKNGPCLTIAEIPTLDECSGLMTYQVTKIFAPPILHEREIVNEAQMKALEVKNQRP